MTGKTGGSENNRSQALVFCFLCDNKGHMIYYTALQSAGQRFSSGTSASLALFRSQSQNHSL